MDKEQLIKKWLTDELTDEERKEFEKLDDHQLNQDILEGAKHFKASHFSSVKSFDEFKSSIRKKKTKVIQLIPYKQLYRIAGLFVIGLGMYFLFFYNNLTTVQTLASEKTTFELPDASSVVLNTDSKTVYSKNEWKNKREVTLDGEAFFKVAKGSTFDVITTSGKVTVVGTQFNVKNRDNYFEVKCYEGIVNVSSKGTTQQLTKGKTFRVVNGIFTVDSTINNKPDWTDNKSSFKSVPVYEVLNELKRQYNIVVETQKINTQILFTGGFVHDSLDQALISIAVPLDISYKKVNPNKIIFYTSPE